jgi:hypothetical protein
MRKEHRLRMCENRVLRRKFGPKREEVVGGWRRLRNEELHNLYDSPHIVKVLVTSFLFPCAQKHKGPIRWMSHFTNREKDLRICKET